MRVRGVRKVVSVPLRLASRALEGISLLCVLSALLYIIFGDTTALAGGLRGAEIIDDLVFSPHHLRNASHLIMVAGFSVTMSQDLANAASDESVWYLLPYQKSQNFPAVIVSHIREGIKRAHEDPRSLLIFSGGQTRQQAGPRSEGYSYYAVSDALHWFGTHEVKSRTAVEEYATDSFENLLFSICRFREITGHYPERITVIGVSYKSYRFDKLHRAALRFPESQFEYVGLDPKEAIPKATKGNTFDLEHARNVEKQLSIIPFTHFPYGCGPTPAHHHTRGPQSHQHVQSQAARSLVHIEGDKSDTTALKPNSESRTLQEMNKQLEGLLQKRIERNPFRRTHPYHRACPEIADLLSWCQPTLYMKPLPWAS